MSSAPPIVRDILERHGIDPADVLEFNLTWDRFSLGTAELVVKMIPRGDKVVALDVTKDVT